MAWACLSLIDQRCSIIEYSDMPEELMNAVDAQGQVGQFICWQSGYLTFLRR